MNGDTVETQRDRVEVVKAAGHTSTQVIELGYARLICSECRSNWPCPDFAQAAEWRG